MPGRFCNLGRWYSTIRPAESLSQSPACHMKSGVLCVCSTNVLVHFVFRCLVCKLPAFSHTTNRFCCLAVPEKCFFFFCLPAFAVYIFFASLVFCTTQYLRLFFVIFHTHCSFSNHVLSWSLSLCNNPPSPPTRFFSTLFCLRSWLV